MIITKNFRQLLAVLVFGIVLILPLGQNVFAQSASAPNIPEICNPPPDDPDIQSECNLYYLTHPRPKEYEPGTDPHNPVIFSADGLSGIAAAYSPKNDSVLIVAGKFVSDGSRQIVGMLADAKTLAPKGAAFRIDQGSSTGVPRIVYSPDFEKFLVVWEDVRPCGKNCRSEYGRFVSSEGAPIGSDFPINQGAAFLSGVTYDSVNKKFVVLYEPAGSFEGLRTVDEQGTVSSQVIVVQSFPYQGQGGVAFNSNTNEYLVAYAVTLSGGDTAKEDDRIYYSRVNAKTMQVVGNPVQLSQTRVGRNAIAGAHVAYSPKGGAVVIWSERGREAIIGTWGRTIYDDGTLSGEYPVITPGNNIYSEGFYSDSISYNPYTDSFFVPTGDQDGNAWMTEIDLNGLIYDSRPALDVVAVVPAKNFFARMFGINTASAAAVGNFNVTAASTPYGAVTFASRNYGAVVGTSFLSANAPAPAQPPVPLPPVTPTSPQDLTALPKLINQIFVWSLGIAALLALLMIIIGGYFYMTSAGNAEQASKGKDYIYSAIIGLILLFASFLILNTINPDLVNFNLDSLNGLNSQPTTQPAAPATTTPSSQTQSAPRQ